MGGDNFFGSNALLHPAFERFQQIMIGIDHWAVDAIAEGVRTVATAAMRHAWHHKEPIEFLDFLPPVATLPARFYACQLGPDTVVVIDAVDRRDRRVRPSHVVDDLATMRPQRPKVWIGRIEDCGKVLVRERDIGREIERAKIEIRILKHEICKEALSKENL
jgi:hypothetical protein